MINSVSAADPAKLKVLYLGDSGHHQPKARYLQLEPVFRDRGIKLTFSDKVADLNPATLAAYDGLMIFANTTEWTPENEKALLDYVASGKGFIPVHCASFCFSKSQAYIDLVGAQFRSHTTGVFRTTRTVTDHPITKSCDTFSSWDETYVHHKHNTKDRTVLETRGDGDLAEPWTWVRTQGKGRVFYTAWGHDQRTWSHPGFQTLLERGVRWACGQNLDGVTTYLDRPKMTPLAADAKPFEFIPATIPFYPPNARKGEPREPVKSMQKPLTAEESLQHYSTPVDFRMKTFITEEKLGGGKPICMTWDERGRLWMGLTFDYPNELKPEGEGRDKIVVCEDIDGDGVADKVTVFADKLSIPTSILNVYGGILVYQAPHTLFLKDTDGDGKADLREVLFTGWNTNDTHAGPSNLRYGPDNWIYGMVGYSGFNGTIAGEKFKFSQGLHRFKLAMKNSKLGVEKFEFLRSTNNNSWGVGFNEDGELFGSTANGCPLVHMTMPNRYYEKIRGLSPGALQNIVNDNHVEPITENIRQVDWHGGFTAAAGCTIYTARTYPPEYWNKAAFVCEPTAHLCATLMLQPNGVTYQARYGWNLCASNDDWAAPIDAQVGPDGHMWIIDWYNVIVQHNPTPQGYKTGKGNAYEIDLRDKKYGRVYRVVYTKAKAEPRINLKDATKEQLLETLKHHNMTWRLHAQRLLVEQGEKIINMQTPEQLQKSEAELLASGKATLRTKLRQLCQYADQPPSEAAATAVWLLLKDRETVEDPTLSQLLTICAGVHEKHLLTMKGDWGTLTPPALTLLEQTARGLASGTNRAAIGDVVLALVQQKAQETVNAVIAGLAAGTPGMSTDLSLNPTQQAAIRQLLEHAKGPTRTRALRLAKVWGVTGLEAALGAISQELFKTLSDDRQTAEARLDAAKQILELQPESEEAPTQLMTIATKASPQLANSVFEVLSTSKSKTLGTIIIGKLKDLPVGVRPAAVRVVLARADSTKAFLDAVEKGELRFDVLELDQKTALAAHPDAAIRERSRKLLALGGGLPDANRQKVIEEFIHVTKKIGDVGLGKKAFTQHCAKCHKHGSEGLTIGPDLTGFAVHPKEEILIHLLDPSRSVEGNFKQYTATISDGRVISGLLAAESKTTIELLDAENKRHAIAREDLEAFKESPKSLMPEGFEKQMKEDELINLLEFLTQKGKYVPIPFDKYATIVSTKGMFHDAASTTERLVFADWKPKDVKGVPFLLVDPQGEKAKNVILLHSTNGTLPPTMPKTVMLPCNTPAKAIHFLSGVSGWGAQSEVANGSVSLIVRLHYEDGKTEDHNLRNGHHFADYIRRADVPGSEFAFEMKGKQQVRYLTVMPKRKDLIKSIELVKGNDKTAPIIVAMTIETP